jgi:uncharacterized protein with PQ loop repeat
MEKLMQIKSISIKNYRSIQDVSFDIVLLGLIYFSLAVIVWNITCKNIARKSNLPFIK